jgi:hypothetical protein
MRPDATFEGALLLPGSEPLVIKRR